MTPRKEQRCRESKMQSPISSDVGTQRTYNFHVLKFLGLEADQSRRPEAGCFCRPALPARAGPAWLSEAKSGTGRGSGGTGRGHPATEANFLPWHVLYARFTTWCRINLQENLVATADLLTGVEYLTLMPQSQHIRRDNDQRCDTTKAGRAGQTSGLGLGRPGRFGHQP